MSAAVLFYQLAIASSILISNILLGRRAGLLIGACWVVWTVVMVFTKPLFILQILTIGLALHGAKQFRSSIYFYKVRKFLAIGIGGIFALGMTLAGIAIYLDSRPKDVPNVARSTTPINDMPSQDQTRTDTLFRKPQANDSYELAVQSVERRYPQLDLFSSEYDAGLVAQVLARRDQLVTQGVSLDRAVIMASDQVFGGSTAVYKCGPNVYQGHPCDTGR